MLKATQKLLTDPDAITCRFLQQPLLKLIARQGDLTDARALLKAFLLHPEEDLLLPLMLLGDSTLADELFAKAITNGKLNPGFPPQSLNALSYLQHPQLLPVLIRYYEQVSDLEWDLHMAVCTALLYADCTGLDELIEKQVGQCLQQPVFQDYAVLPAVHLKDNWTSRLLAHAEGAASPSCCGPIILLVALRGQRNRGLFKSLVLVPGWAVNPFENNTLFIATGMHVLGITLQELYADMREVLGKSSADAASVLTQFGWLLEFKVKGKYGIPLRHVSEDEESFTQLFGLVFHNNYQRPDQSIFGLIDQMVLGAQEIRIREMFECLEAQFVVRVGQEVEALYGLQAQD